MQGFRVYGVRRFKRFGFTAYRVQWFVQLGARPSGDCEPQHPEQQESRQPSSQTPQIGVLIIRLRLPDRLGIVLLITNRSGFHIAPPKKH